MSTVPALEGALIVDKFGDADQGLEKKRQNGAAPAIC